MVQVEYSHALLRAVLGDACASDAIAALYLEAAQAADVDPLDYCAHRFGLGNRTVWQRAAHWAGFDFRPQIPDPASGAGVMVADLGMLGGARSLIQMEHDVGLVFAAPDFWQVLELAAARRQGSEPPQRICIAPPDVIAASLARAAAPALLEQARQRLTRKWPRATAALDLGLMARIGFVIGMAAVTTAVITASAWSKPIVLPLMAVLLLLPGLVRLAAAVRWDRHPHPRDLPRLDDAALPVYTVLLPLCNEAEMVPQLAQAMAALDYPPEKLDIKFVVEARCRTTITAVEAVLGDPRFSLVTVPDAAPRTKPKALNYALPLARGSHIVVYDAEDVPEPDQLRLAASRFAADRRLACLQAELVPENAGENWLTALFAGEYAGAVRPAATGAGALAPAAAARGNEQSFPHQRAEGDRRLGPVQRHRGRRPGRAAGAAAPPHRHLFEPHL